LKKYQLICTEDIHFSTRIFSQSLGATRDINTKKRKEKKCNNLRKIKSFFFSLRNQNYSKIDRDTKVYGNRVLNSIQMIFVEINLIMNQVNRNIHTL